MYDDPMAELEKIADSIKMGELSPIPSTPVRQRRYKFEDGTVKNVDNIGASSAYL
jgi:hypothetical protein